MIKAFDPLWLDPWAVDHAEILVMFGLWLFLEASVGLAPLQRAAKEGHPRRWRGSYTLKPSLFSLPDSIEAAEALMGGWNSTLCSPGVERKLG